MRPGAGFPWSSRTWPSPFVWLYVTRPPAVPLYRSGYFSFNAADQRELNIWLLPADEKLSAAEDSFSAGDVSAALTGAGLPRNTVITAAPNSLSFKGTRADGEISVKFSISIVPDTSADLSDFLDVALKSWDINVSWPVSWWKSAEDVLTSVKAGISEAGTSVNAAVLARMETTLEQQDQVLPGLAKNFFENEVSVTFMDVEFPLTHSWDLSNTTDPALVVRAIPVLASRGASPPTRPSRWPSRRGCSGSTPSGRAFRDGDGRALRGRHRPGRDGRGVRQNWPARPADSARTAASARAQSAARAASVSAGTAIDASPPSPSGPCLGFGLASKIIVPLTCHYPRSPVVRHGHPRTAR